MDGLGFVGVGLGEAGEVVDEEVERVGVDERVGEGLDGGEVGGVLGVGEVGEERSGRGCEVDIVVGEEGGEGGGEADGDEVREELGRAGEEAEAVGFGVERDLRVGEAGGVVGVLHARLEVVSEAALEGQQEAFGGPEVEHLDGVSGGEVELPRAGVGLIGSLALVNGGGVHRLGFANFALKNAAEVDR